jgi:para-nitrobenzyl esterase
MIRSSKRFGWAFLFATWLVGCGSDEPASGSHATDGGAVDAANDTTSDAPPEVSEAGSFDVASNPPEEIELTTGEVRGQLEGDVLSFRGIPYAAPPVGDNRWLPPQPVDPWDEVREAIEAGPFCPQPMQFLNAAMAGTSEDCLYLNVWAPKETPPQGLPVMVWLHGGAFISGSGSSDVYDGTALVERGDVIVVSINYRLGPFGFLYDEQARAAASGEPPSGNQGLEDQIAALSWVAREIAAFGGDPDKVTVFGESAGAMSICALMTAPKAAGLFHRAIMQSGACAGTRYPSPADGEARTAMVAKNAGCPAGDGRFDCLRSLSAEALVEATFRSDFPPGGLLYNANPAIVFIPVVDGELLPGQPSDRLATGDFHKVPVLLGTNRDEGTLFHSGIIGDHKVDSEAEYLAALDRLFGSDATAVAASYPVSDFTSANEALTTVTTHAIFNCPARRTAKVLAASGVPAFLYLFSAEPEGVFMPGLGSFHGAELFYVFNSDGGLLGHVGDADLQLSETMMDFWTEHANSGAPGAAGGEVWPDFAGNETHLELATPLSSGSEFDPACDFWDTITTPWPQL